MAKKEKKHARMIRWMKIDRLTQVALAKKLGCTYTHVFNILRLRRGISPKMAKKIEQLSKGEVSRLEALYPTEKWR